MGNCRWLSGWRFWCNLVVGLCITGISAKASNTGGPTSVKPNRFYFATYIATNVTSAASGYSVGLQDDASGKWNYGVRMGYIFWSPRRLTFSLESGATYRDYGFEQNGSTIPYLSLPGLLRLRLGKGFLSVNAYGGAEYNRLIESKYVYPDGGSGKHNLFLHQNDAVTGLYGLGIVLGKRRVKFEVFTENIVQLDSFDLQYGKTLGARTLGISLQIKLF